MTVSSERVAVSVTGAGDGVSPIIQLTVHTRHDVGGGELGTDVGHGFVGCHHFALVGSETTCFKGTTTREAEAARHGGFVGVAVRREMVAIFG